MPPFLRQPGRHRGTIQAIDTSAQNGPPFPMTTTGPGAHYAAWAAEVAAKLKPGTYDAVQALSLLSIAQSLASIAEHMERAQQA